MVSEQLQCWTGCGEPWGVCEQGRARLALHLGPSLSPPAMMGPLLELIQSQSEDLSPVFISPASITCSRALPSPARAGSQEVPLTKCTHTHSLKVMN